MSTQSWLVAQHDSRYLVEALPKKLAERKAKFLEGRTHPADYLREAWNLVTETEDQVAHALDSNSPPLIGTRSANEQRVKHQVCRETCRERIREAVASL